MLKKKIAGILGLLCLMGVFTNVGHKQNVASADNDVFYENLQENAISTQAESLEIKGKSAYLMDYATTTPIFMKNEKEHLPIASMCKIMTLILTFEAIDNGALSIDEEVTVSERAASMGGSQVFLEANAKYPVKELIKSIVV